jgi:hypothetical protein
MTKPEALGEFRYELMDALSSGLTVMELSVEVARVIEKILPGRKLPEKFSKEE